MLFLTNCYVWKELFSFKLNANSIVVLVVVVGLFAKLAWPENSKGSFQFSSQAATCLPHMGETTQSHCSILLLNIKQEAVDTIFYSF